MTNDTISTIPAPGADLSDRLLSLVNRGNSTPRIRSNALLGQGGELVIEHGGRDYKLRITQNGKLILTA